jgi:hypothetical protein
MTRTPSGHIEQLPSGSWRPKVYARKNPLTGREIRFRKPAIGRRVFPRQRGVQELIERRVVRFHPEQRDVADWAGLPAAVLRSGLSFE